MARRWSLSHEFAIAMRSSERFMNQSRNVRSAALAWAMCLAVVGVGTAGCGGSGGKPTAHLQGTVTLAGQPVPADATAHISFTPAGKDQATAASAPIVDGKYDCPAAPEGAVRVFFNITQPTGPEYTTDRGEKARHMKDLLPPKYGSGLELQVTGENAEQNFDL
jgi:hypothetical protein